MDRKQYTRCVVDEVVESHYIPLRYYSTQNGRQDGRYTTNGVLPMTVTSAMQRRQKVVYLSKLEIIDVSSSQQRSQGKQKRGRKCRAILRDEWLSTRLHSGDIIHLIGEWRDEIKESIDAISPNADNHIDSEDPEEALWKEMDDFPDCSPCDDKPTISTDPEEALWNDMPDFPDSSSPCNMKPTIPTMILASTLQSVDQHQAEAGPSLTTNLLILHPDVLLSATAVSTVIRCTRKPYLQSKIKASGPSSEDAPSESLTLGKMLHEVLQSCLTGRSKSRDSTATVVAIPEEMENGKEPPFPLMWKGPEPTNFSLSFVNEQIKSQVQCSLEDVLIAGLDTKTAVEKLWEAAAPFGLFASRYLLSNENGLPRKDAIAVDARCSIPPLVRVKQVLDVEEDIWSPMYGLKGFVDVSVEVEILENKAGMDNKTATKKEKTFVMPLELKTGRSIDRVQHQAQTMLYMLMMSDRYNQDINSGLLYYSKTSTLHLVRSLSNEVRGLLMARNELADYLARRPGTDQARSNLPPTIDRERDCSRCYVADECMLYKRAVEDGILDQDDESPIASIYNSKVSHLTEQHVAFFKHWEHLLTLEEDDIVRFRRQLWTMTAAAREATGRCLADMTLVVHVEENDFEARKRSKSASGMNDRILYRFVRGGVSNTFLGGSFAVGDPISLSIEPDMYSVAQGHLLELSSNYVVVAVDRNIEQVVKRFKKRNLIFRIDKEEFASGMAKVRYNLAKLFYQGSHGDIRRRELIVELREPQFRTVVKKKACLANSVLNENQREAVEKVLTAEDYAIIVGMPGTGKTTTIVELIKELIGRGNSILLTSYTHSAVDTICRKLALQESVKLLRLGSKDRVHGDIHSFTLKSQISVEKLREQLMEPNVVATTCLSINHALFTKRRFDYCIVDEASQITLPTCLGPLRYADRFVLVGDSLQLPPLVKNALAKEAGLDVSLFDLLQKAHPQAVAQLRVQYRMNRDIMKLSNELIYNGELQCGNEEIANSCLKLPFINEARIKMHPSGSKKSTSKDCWMERVFREETRALFIDTDSVPGKERRVGETLLENDVEADIVTQLCAALACGGVPLAEIAIITPYRQQLRALVKRIGSAAAASDKIEILTADKSQGRDKDVVILSMVRSNDFREVQGDVSEDAGIGQLLNDAKRINVALTRARKKLIIVGSRNTLNRSALLKMLWDLMDNNGWTMDISAKQLQQHQNLVSTVFAPTTTTPSTTPKQKRKNSSQTFLRRKRILQDVLNEII